MVSGNINQNERLQSKSTLLAQSHNQYRSIAYDLVQFLIRYRYQIR